MSKRVVLSPSERQRLGERVRSRRARAEEVLRAKTILLLANGESQWAVSRQLGCSINTVRLWLKRFLEERLASSCAKVQKDNLIFFSEYRRGLVQETTAHAHKLIFGFLAELSERHRFNVQAEKFQRSHCRRYLEGWMS